MTSPLTSALDGRARLGQPARRRTPTATSRFGSSRREAHDASAFYERFTAPQVSDDETIGATHDTDVIHVADARRMARVATSSVALVVTSPPYFAGKEYEANLGRAGVPASYLEYLELLRSVFAECVRVLEPGGRIAVNVANLGRRPYRSLSSDVIGILQDDLGLLLRGEVIWVKGRASTGSCAWGSFQSPSNPVLRDVTERVVIAAKGRFSRALEPRRREAKGLPSMATITRDEFLEATTDVWEMPPESARRVGHPAPFPVELPQRLIELYTYRDDIVLDPFVGSGTTAIAALRTGRRYIGYDNDAVYVQTALARIAQERVLLEGNGSAASGDRSPNVAPKPAEAVLRARRGGYKATDVARICVEQCGFREVRENPSVAGVGLELALGATDRRGKPWAFAVCGSFVAGRSGPARADTLWRVIGQASVFRQVRPEVPLVVLATELPDRASAPAAALAEVTGPGRPILDAIAILDGAGQRRLRGYARHGAP